MPWSKTNLPKVLLILLSVILIAGFILIVFVAQRFENKKTDTVANEAAQTEKFSRALRPGCYYRLNCQPRKSGNQSLFSCAPKLICPTPTQFPVPTTASTGLSCSDCAGSGKMTLCFDNTRKISYCYDAFIAYDPNISCVGCIPTPTSLPEPTPTWIPSPSCVIGPPCVYKEPYCDLAPPEGGWCPVGCFYQGKKYSSGEGFPAEDGCNSCSCYNGEVSCTLIGCWFPHKNNLGSCLGWFDSTSRYRYSCLHTLWADRSIRAIHIFLLVHEYGWGIMLIFLVKLTILNTLNL